MRQMMNSGRLCIITYILGCFVLKTTYAALGSAWTNPVINSISGSGTIANSLAEDATVFPQLAATGATNYVIDSQTPDGIFTVTAATGQLALAANQQLDYETATQHVLVVKVDDSSSTATATITINISDVNDNPPTFSKTKYSACIVDNTASGAPLITLSTIADPDTTTAANALSAVTIAAGNTNSDFAINAATFAITTAKTLNMTATPGYALQVEAEDSDSGTKLTGTASVFVVVAEACGGSNSGVGIAAGSLVTLLSVLIATYSS